MNFPHPLSKHFGPSNGIMEKLPPNLKQKAESERAKKVILQAIADGLTVEQAAKAAGKTLKSYEFVS